ncbi:RNA polymerase sigma factor [Wenzhouxiangella sp. XN79A]|uniref:RNA polymerase sigma factor n=1 Tax=Wenzhouxiangella sp. XN79A TaxID=2724193 RepID=UPI00144AEF37|nr:RNA polymerase sigma factor [Wenzhouxiangella sp. XN79A]NKI33631.1 RNA polymerase sigma factor [Wenzhouxiangella sp. XN79A]
MDARARFEALFDQHDAQLRAFLRARFRGVPGVGVDDLMQELRLRLWQALERETTIDQPASYLMQAAVRVMIDAKRRAAVRRPEGGFVELVPDDAPPPETTEPQPAAPEHDVERREALARLGAALDSLAPDRARMVRLYLQGFGAAEIARLIGWTEPRCRNLLYRGLADLKAELGIEE